MAALDSWAGLQQMFADNVPQGGIPGTGTEEYAKRSRILDQAHRRIIKRRAWNFLIDTSTDTTVADQQLYDLPSGSRELLEVSVGNSLPYVKIKWQQAKMFLNGLTVASLPAAYGGQIRGQYYVKGDQFGFAPTPQSGGQTINLTFVENRTALTAASAETDYLIPEDYRDAWVLEAVVQWYRSRGELDFNLALKGDANDAYKALVKYDKRFDPIGKVYDKAYAPQYEESSNQYLRVGNIDGPA